MFWTIFIIIIVGYIIFSFVRDREEMLQRQVDMRGGMTKKYEYLIGRLAEYPGARVIKVTRDHVHIRAEGQATATNFLISENFNKVEIEWVGQLAILGTHRHKWSFPHDFPQEKMIKEMEEYMEWKANQVFGDDL